MSLKERLQSLASNFASEVLGAVRAASIEELTAGGAAASTSKGRSTRSGSSGRLPRRSLEQIGAEVDRIAGLLSKKPEGLRAEQIRVELDLEPRELPRVLKQGVRDRKIKVLSGNKRSTTYGAGGGGAGKVTKKAAKVAKSSKPAAKKKASSKTKGRSKPRSKKSK